MQRKFKVAGICVGLLFVAILGFTTRGSRSVHPSRVEMTVTPDGKTVFVSRGNDAACVIVNGASNLVGNPSFATNQPAGK